MKIELGKKYEDSISGFVGTAVARTTYLYSCPRVLLVSEKVTKDANPNENWFDGGRLQILSKKLSIGLNEE